ncbi:MAG TPA: hypothetical protein VJR89_19925 [Polyangiales bacterium]|nr:hypothetical protein [Polyangiales bacterium]
MTSIRGFKLVFTSIGVIYIIMASSWLMRGPVVMLDFGVPESVLSEPVLQDFFFFFYQFMVFIGVLMVLFGQVARERKTQLLVASVFCIANILFALHDLSTSDSRFGNHLYKGDATLVFVYISLAIAAAFGYLAMKGLTGQKITAEPARG